MTNPTKSQMRLLADYDRAAKRFSNPRDIYDFLLLDRLERIATALERLRLPLYYKTVFPAYAVYF